MSEEEQRTFLRTVGQFVIDQVKERIAPLKREIEELKEKQANWRYCGTWYEGASYKAGNFVTLDGSLFHANRDTAAKPGKDPVSWSLCVKRGRDGQDAKDQAA